MAKAPATKQETTDVIVKAEEQLSYAREIVRRDAPYVMATVYGFINTPCPSIPTMAVTRGMNMLFNPEWVVKQSETRLAAAYMHEVQHHLREHLKRGEKAPDKKLFNTAADIPINDNLKEAGWDTGEDWFYHDTFNVPPGLTMEEYYGLLEKEQEKNPNPPNGKDQGQGQGVGEGSGNGQGDNNGIGRGSCGGCTGNPEEEKAEQDADAEMSRTEADQQRFADQTFEDIKAADQKGRGSVPGWLKELAKAAMEAPKVPWQRKVQQVVRKSTGQIVSGGFDFSLARPSKRSLIRGILRPGMIDCTPEVAFILDTSGSMGLDTQIRDALREAAGCMKVCGIDRVWVIQADYAVSEIKRMTVNQVKSMEVKGRGGTSFIPSIEAATKLRPRPNLIVYFTDGDGEAPERPPPGTAFIWCIVPSAWQRKPAHWGHVVVVQDGAHPLESIDDEDEALPLAKCSSLLFG
jgi:predicted metal-dependent peptidase